MLMLCCYWDQNLPFSFAHDSPDEAELDEDALYETSQRDVRDGLDIFKWM